MWALTQDIVFVCKLLLLPLEIQYMGAFARQTTDTVVTYTLYERSSETKASYVFLPNNQHEWTQTNTSKAMRNTIYQNFQVKKLTGIPLVHCHHKWSVEWMVPPLVSLVYQLGEECP